MLRVPNWSVPTLRRLKLAASPYPLFPRREIAGDPSNVVRRLADEMKAVDYGVEVKSHTFCKTVATALHDVGQPITAVADHLGNAPAIVEKHYRAKGLANERGADTLEGIICKRGIDLGLCPLGMLARSSGSAAWHRPPER